ncbi:MULTISPECIES: FKBP-type peptidyl-prolyl cis-trans isomerase [Hymenobacter]|uniref:peptidylprolyl isomerase n=1 Tax=Hymenobacter mucosus TaxID=1411120 RepID=A0A238ZRP2_9BACT|nr:MULTISPECIES: FKBP-type peptidyl-prolyl cis-trans isomerase [Hymenobacter]SNR85333.1 FKBP-type peptidyl-prolyl cis-trans isomerase [Hymenobacter mucosus]
MLLQRTFLSLAVTAGVLSLASCNKDGEFKKTKSGIEYKIFKKDGSGYSYRSENAEADTAAYKARIGKIMTAHIEYRTSKDSVLQSSRKNMFGFPTFIQLQPVANKGTELEALSLLQPGDSGVFRFNVDSMFVRNTGQPAPPQVKKMGTTLTFFVKAVELMDEAKAKTVSEQMRPQIQAKIKQQATAQLAKDDQQLQDYIKKNNLTAQKDTSGVYYVVTQPGTGPKPKTGQLVSVKYKGSLLSGKVFDTSEKAPNNGKPVDFPIGVGGVIPGWDRVIPLLNKGSKATLLIPSGLAYGARGAGADIPADSPLRFDVELVDVKAAPPQPAGPSAADIQRQIEAMQQQQQAQGGR